MITFPCPKCQATLKAPEERGGAHSKCRQCGCPVQVPVVATPVPVAWPVAPARGGRRRLPTWAVLLIIVGGAALAVGLPALIVPLAQKPDRSAEELPTVTIEELYETYYSLPDGAEDFRRRYQGKRVRLIGAWVAGVCESPMRCVTMTQTFWPDYHNPGWARQHMLIANCGCSLAADAGPVPDTYDLNHGGAWITGTVGQGPDQLTDCRFVRR
jgi:hypothetical protein